jgi:hypothetical protein
MIEVGEKELTYSKNIPGSDPLGQVLNHFLIRMTARAYKRYRKSTDTISQIGNLETWNLNVELSWSKSPAVAMAIDHIDVWLC